jgi:hypothetical protein
MASIPTNGYAEVMAGTNNYSGSNSYDASCPRTAIPPVIGDDLCNKTYVDNATGGGIIGLLTDKGSLITGDGTQAVIFDQNPYQTALTTTTVYDWNSLALGQSRQFTTTAPTLIPLGAEITITYSGTDSIKGTITAVAGTTITITITNLASLSYSSNFLLQTSGPDALGGGDDTNETFPFNPAFTTPIPPDIPANTIITDGEFFIYTTAGGVPVSITANIIGSNIQRPSATPFTTIPYENPPVTPTNFNFPSGCFVGTTQSPSVQFFGGTYFHGFPTGGSYIPKNYVGSLSGYTLAYGTGSIVIDDDICLIADATSATGLAWGVINTASIGAVTSVSGGTNIVMSGTVPAPIVNLRNPLTAELNMGSQSLRDSASAVGTSGQLLSAGTGGQTLWTNAPSANPTITDTNTNATYYPTFVAGAGTQPLLADISTGPISLNPSNGDFNVVDTLKLTQTQVAVGKNAGLTSQSASAVAVGQNAGNFSQGSNAVAVGLNAGAGVSGTNFQGANAVAIGNNAGQGTQGISAVAIGSNAGFTNQGTQSIAIGEYAGFNTQQLNSIAIGRNAGEVTQATASIAIGWDAAKTGQNTNCIAIGIDAARVNQQSGSVAIGFQGGRNTQGTKSIAIGYEAGDTIQGQNSVAIGNNAGFNTQGTFNVAIGNNAGQTTQGNNATAVGQAAGSSNQGGNATAFGAGAGQTNQGASCVAVGVSAGLTTQGQNSVAIGSAAGSSTQGQSSVAVGVNAGQTTQGNSSVAVGAAAGITNQGGSAVAVGLNAGGTNQAGNSIAIGGNAGNSGQLANAVSVGFRAGQNNQQLYGVAMGLDAGQTTQGQDSIAIGRTAGQTTQGSASVAIGFQAGENSQGDSCVAIGRNAGQGTTTAQGDNSVAIGNNAAVASQTAGSIALNASGFALNPNQAGMFVRPIRAGAPGTTFTPNLPPYVLYYGRDASLLLTYEILYTT